jgi:hypothetical protein
MISIYENKDNTVILNWFKESTRYVKSLGNVVWVWEQKSYDGYSMLQCYETKN